MTSKQGPPKYPSQPWTAQRVAHLITVAPFLLHALREMVATHQPCAKSIGAPGSDARARQDEQAAAVLLARAAIAMTGEEVGPL